MKKETSCINARAVLDYMIEKNNWNVSELLDNLDPEINRLPDPEGFLRDPNNWISCEVASKLYERARILLNDEMAAYNIGSYAAENHNLGYAQSIIVKTFWSIKKGLKDLQKINDKWNRNKKVDLHEIKSNEAIVRLQWNPDMKVSKDICLYNQGAYSYMPVVWGGKPITLSEKCCYFEGAPYCEYHLKWTTRNRFYELYSRFFSSKLVLSDTIKEMGEDKKLIERKYEEVKKLNNELEQKVKQLQAIQETGKAILSVHELEQLLNVIMNTLSNVCKIDHAVILLVSDKEEYLEYVYATGHDTVQEKLKNFKIPFKQVSNIFIRVTNTGKSEYIPDVLNSNLSKENISLIHEYPTALYVIPLVARLKVIGVLVTDTSDKSGIPIETRETLEIFAPQVAIAIENARLYKRLQEQMVEIKRSHALLTRTEKFMFMGNLAARLAHEIKNPMTAIDTFIQMLPYQHQDEEYRGRFYSVALEETERVNRLISELLDLVKTKDSNYEENDLNGLLAKMLLLITPQSKSKKIRLVRKFDSRIKKVWFDNEKMKQVILNILSNAVDFTPEAGKIEITTIIVNNSGKHKGVRIAIKDNGEGIPAESIKNIFDPYFTTRHKSKVHSGTGLGLFIAYQNILDHNGTIDVQSQKKKGTTFIITLPNEPSQ